MRRHLTYANVVATLALVLAVGGGTAYAAVKLAPNSVGSPQLKNGSVKSADVKDGALLAADFKAGQLPAGAVGPAGPAGQKGAAGTNGTARAFARVSSTGVLQSTPPALGIGSAGKLLGTGIYCVVTSVGLTPANAIMIAVPELAEVAAGRAQVETANNVNCPGGFVVRTFDKNGDATNAGFVAMVP